MFEDPKSFEADKDAASRHWQSASEAGSGGSALRAIDWAETAARLNAMRELRAEIRSEAGLLAPTSGASFGDAAAHYFKQSGENERPVNRDALEARKCLDAKSSQSDRNGTASHRETRND